MPEGGPVLAKVNQHEGLVERARAEQRNQGLLAQCLCKDLPAFCACSKLCEVLCELVCPGCGGCMQRAPWPKTLHTQLLFHSGGAKNRSQFLHEVLRLSCPSLGSAQPSHPQLETEGEHSPVAEDFSVGQAVLHFSSVVPLGRFAFHHVVQPPALCLFKTIKVCRR